MGKKNWIKGAIKRPGEFTRKAKERGMTVPQFRNAVLKNPNKYRKLTVQQANMANTLSKFNMGGAYDNPTLPTSSSTMSSSPGQQQAQQQFNELQYESRRAQRMNERAAELEQKQLEEQSKQNFQNTYTQAAPQLTNLAAQAKKLDGFKNLGVGAKMTGLGVGATLLGAGIEEVSDDQDATTMNFGETSGTLLKGAGSGLSLAGTLSGFAPALAIPGLGWAAAGIGAGVAGIKALRNRNEARDIQELEDNELAAQETRINRAKNAAFRQASTMTGTDLGYNIGSSMSNSYLPGYQSFRGGGEMIKRADGSYSPRGLWDNIRANEGSGKKPTKEMLKQERKIKAEEKKTGGTKVPGGTINSLPGGAVEFKGRKHAQGGIMIDPMTEVEGGETMDKGNMSKGTPSDYIFSEHLKLGGKSFAQRHKEILKRGGGNARMQRKIQNLAKLQESVAAKDGESGRSPAKVMQDGGDLTDPSVVAGTNVLRDMPTDQSSFDPGLFTASEGFTLDQVKERNPWFDWENFDPQNAEDVKRFQKAYNDKVPAKDEITVDGKFGDQTASIYLNMKEMDPIVQGEKSEIPTAEIQGEEQYKKAAEDVMKKDSTPETPDKKRMNLLPAAGAALLGLAQLPGKFKEGPKAANITPQQTGKIKLPRVNYNAERAASAAGTASVNRSIQNQVAGPASIAAMTANTQNQRQNNLDIANQEARANKQLMTQEAMTNAQIAQQNAGNVMQAQQFNEQSRYNKELEDYQQKILRREKIGDTITGIGRDFMGYRADERLATAADDTGSYMRFIQNNPGLAKQLFQNQDNATESKTGGYIRRSNKVRRKKRK